MIKLVDTEQIIMVHEGKNIDFDRYNIEVKTQLSTKQYSVVVDFEKKEITGDCVAYGGWNDIELSECIELLAEIFKDNEPIRQFGKEFYEGVA